MLHSLRLRLVCNEVVLNDVKNSLIKLLIYSDCIRPLASCDVDQEGRSEWLERNTRLV